MASLILQSTPEDHPRESQRVEGFVFQALSRIPVGCEWGRGCPLLCLSSAVSHEREQKELGVLTRGVDSGRLHTRIQLS